MVEAEIANDEYGNYLYGEVEKIRNACIDWLL
jgi:hypothetical protein